MTHAITVQNMRTGYQEILRTVLEPMWTSIVSPRGRKTREVDGPVTIRLVDPADNLPLGVGRGIVPAVAAMEALQLIGGFSDPAEMFRLSPKFRDFADGGGFKAPYGDRTANQMHRIIERLTDDPSSRQAVLQFWDPARDLYVDGWRDYPCTVFMQFMIRDDELVAFTTMRSNDAWRGLPYDVFQFSVLQQTVANVLGIQCGPYYHTANSLHLYEENWADAAKCASTRSDGESVEATGIGTVPMSWKEVQYWAQQLFYGHVMGVDPFEQYLVNTLNRKRELVDR